MPKRAVLNTPGHRKRCENKVLYDKSMILPPYLLILASSTNIMLALNIYIFLILLFHRKKFNFKQKSDPGICQKKKEFCPYL